MAGETPPAWQNRDAFVVRVEDGRQFSGLALFGLLVVLWAESDDGEGPL